MEEVNRLFMEENDEKALTLLYELTKDEVVKVALNWCKEYELELDNVYSNELYMYNDIISALYKKYNIGE
jgi:hypothetical protein